MDEPLVRLRCGAKNCRRVLLEFFEPARYNDLIAEIRTTGDHDRAQRTACRPADWSGRTQLAPCPRHDKSDLSFHAWARRREERGQERTIILRFVEHADLRHMFYLADTTQRTQEDVLNR